MNAGSLTLYVNVALYPLNTSIRGRKNKNCSSPDLQLDVHLDCAPLDAALQGGLRVLQQQPDPALRGVHRDPLQKLLQLLGQNIFLIHGRMLASCCHTVTWPSSWYSGCDWQSENQNSIEFLFRLFSNNTRQARAANKLEFLNFDIDTFGKVLLQHFFSVQYQEIASTTSKF